MNRKVMHVLGAAVSILLGSYTVAACAEPEPLAGPGASAAAEPTSASRLQQVLTTKTLKVCTTGDYRPFSYLDPATQQWSGIDIDMARNLAERMGAKAEFVQTTWKQLMPTYLKQCDIAVGGISISLERAEQVYFTDPTFRDGKTAVTLCPNVTKFDTVAEINQPGVRSITPMGGTNEKFAEANYPKGQVIEFEDNNKIFDEIMAGRADVMTTDLPEALWVSHQHPELCAANAEKPFTYSQMGYMLPLGDDVFREYVNQWLNIALNDGTHAKAEAPWFGADAPVAG